MSVEPSVVLTSTAGEPRLTLTDPIIEFGNVGRYRVTLDSSGLHATADVYAYGDDGLVGFIDELAREWRGWDGVKDWHSLEGHLSLSATADRLGHVSVEVRIQADPSGEPWIARATLQLEAGSSLEHLARQFRMFFQSDSTGT